MSDTRTHTQAGTDLDGTVLPLLFGCVAQHTSQSHGTRLADSPHAASDRHNNKPANLNGLSPRGEESSLVGVFRLTIRQFLSTSLRFKAYKRRMVPFCVLFRVGFS